MDGGTSARQARGVNVRMRTKMRGTQIGKNRNARVASFRRESGLLYLENPKSKFLKGVQSCVSEMDLSQLAMAAGGDTASSQYIPQRGNFKQFEREEDAVEEE